MIIKSANFVGSATALDKCPTANLPEYAFIGRSNVGKSSLLNMLVEKKGLAKISATPGKTQLINHFLVNENWHLVDLPGYGYAKVSMKEREKWSKFIDTYIEKRDNLVYLFVLLDSRLEPQAVDLKFMERIGLNAIPFVMVFTKIDKLSKTEQAKNFETYKKTMLKTWEELPPVFFTSTTIGAGKDEILDFIENENNLFIQRSKGI